MELNAVNRSRLVLDGHHFALRRFRRNLELRQERRGSAQVYRLRSLHHPLRI